MVVIADAIRCIQELLMHVLQFCRAWLGPLTVTPLTVFVDKTFCYFVFKLLLFRLGPATTSQRSPGQQVWIWLNSLGTIAIKSKTWMLQLRVLGSCCVRPRAQVCRCSFPDMPLKGTCCGLMCEVYASKMGTLDWRRPQARGSIGSWVAMNSIEHFAWVITNW
jgi:hypothetical protein